MPKIPGRIFQPLSAPQRGPTADGGRPDGPAGQAGSAACPGWPWGSLLGHCVSFEHGFLADAEDPLEDLLPGTNIRALNG